MNTINRATHREENGRVSINQGWTPSGVMNRLAAYEDLEEQGRLVVLPCKVGTEVWSSCFTKVLDDGSEIPTKWPFCLAMLDEWGKCFFATRAEAEKAMEVRE